MDKFEQELERELKSLEESFDTIEPTLEDAIIHKVLFPKKTIPEIPEFGDVGTAIRIKWLKRVLDLYRKCNQPEQQTPFHVVNPSVQQRLFNYFTDSHGITITESDVTEILNILAPAKDEKVMSAEEFRSSKYPCSPQYDTVPVDVSDEIAEAYAKYVIGQQEKTCEWTLIDTGEYKTGCNSDFYNADFIPKHYHFCVHCGGKITIKEDK